MRAGYLVLALLSMPWAARAHGDAVEAFGIPMARRPDAAPPAGAVPRGPGAGLSFANGGFETLAGSQPAQWTTVNSPATRLESANRHARVGNAHYYSQSIAVPFANRHVTASARYRCETSAFPSFTVFAPTSAETLFDAKTWSIGSGDGWVRLSATFAITEPTANFAVIPRTGATVSWADLDDVVAFDEGIADGRFEGAADGEPFPAWELAGGAATVADATMDATGTTALRLADGAAASIVSGAKAAGQLYFAAASARGDGGMGTLRVRARDANPLAAAADHFSMDLAIGTAPQRILVATGETPDGCDAERIAFEHAGGSAVLVDDASRGFVHAWPPAYFSGDASLNPELRLVAAWPGKLASASVAIRDGNGDLVSMVPLQVAEGSATGAWNGDGSAAGNFEAEFLLTAESGATVTLTRAFEHRTGSGAAAEAPVFASTRFERGAWIWLFNNGTEQAELQPIFAQAQADGFTFAIVFAGSSQWAGVRAACEALSMPFVASSIESHAMVRGEPPGISGFSFDEFESAVVQELAPALGSPMMLGTYAVDEPILKWEQRNAGDAMRSVAAIPSLGVPFTTITPFNAEPATWDIVKPPVHMTDFYPFANGETDFAERLHALSGHLQEQVALAAERGREYWLVAGAYGSVDGATQGNPSAVEATFGLCVAHGVRGMVPFFYRQINALEGIRTDALEPLPETAAWIDGNARIASIEDDFAGFSQHADAAPGLQSFVVTTLRDAADAPLLCAVNVDCRRNARLSIAFSGSSATLTELTTGESLSTASGTIDVPFGPGDWYVWRVEGAGATGFSETIVPALPAVLPLEVLGDTTLGAGTVHDLRFNSSGGIVLASCGGTVYRLLSTASTLNAIPVFGVTSSTWLSASDALLCSPAIGAYGVRFPSTSLFDSWLRVPGCAVGSVSAGGGAAWIGNDFLGIRRLQPTGTLAFASSNAGPIPAVAARGLQGPLPNGAVLVPDIFGNVVGVAADGGSGVLTATIPGPPIVSNGSLSPDGGLMAMGRQRRGFSLVAFDPGGAVLGTREHAAPNGESVAVVEAMSSTLLAVGESDGDIDFFGVEPDLSLVHRGRWRPAARPAQRLTAMDSANGVLACGFADGRFVVVNASQLPAEFVDSDLLAIK